MTDTQQGMAIIHRETAVREEGGSAQAAEEGSARIASGADEGISSPGRQQGHDDGQMELRNSGAHTDKASGTYLSK